MIFDWWISIGFVCFKARCFQTLIFAFSHFLVFFVDSQVEIQGF